MRTATAVLAFAISVTGFAFAQSKTPRRIELPTVKIERGDACVAPTEEMRRDHMGMLMHQRDLATRRGVRKSRFSLKNCVECHASSDTGSVLGGDGFCSSCHTYASVSIDCFECHTPLRQGGGAKK